MKRRRVLVIVGIAVVVIAIAGVAFWEYHEQPQFCATCHIMDSYLESWESSSLLVHDHAEENITCLDCHEPTIEQQVHELVVFVQGDYRDPLKMRKFPDDECLECHEHGSYEDIIQRTANYTVNGQKVNPHDPHISNENEFKCYHCHKMHRESPGLDYCYGCHHSGELVSCSECH